MIDRRAPEATSRTIEALHARSLLHASGGACLTGVPQGLYADGWAANEFSFDVLAVRDIKRLTMHAEVPDTGSPVTISIWARDRLLKRVAFGPGSVQVSGGLRIARGTTQRIRVVVSATANVGDDERNLGIRPLAFEFEARGAASFQCNLCGSPSAFGDDLEPEGILCGTCGANMRWRSLVRLLSVHLYGTSLCVPDWLPRLDVTVLGVSDDFRLARVLPRAVRYRNTQFDSALADEATPMMDVTRPLPELQGVADVVTCSEVLEHVEPPVQPAFDGLFSLLKPGGLLIFTVPYGLCETIEHFPDLHRWRLEERGERRVLVNQVRSGEVQEFEDLRFHGGGQDVLEMRVFGIDDVVERLQAAGFTDVRVRDENDLEHGICVKYPWGIPITARRPGRA